MALAVGFLAERYGRSRAGWMALAMVLSPLIAVLLLLAGGKVEADDGPIRITRGVDYRNGH
jgi:hypothetical protein